MLPNLQSALHAAQEFLARCYLLGPLASTRANIANAGASLGAVLAVSIVLLPLLLPHRCAASDVLVADNFDLQPNSNIWAAAMHPDGRIIIGGSFTALRNTPKKYLACLNPNGFIDQSFTAEANYIVSAIAVQPDGKICVGGAFTELGGKPRTLIGRLNSDGSVDDTFDPGVGTGVQVGALALRPDGKIWVGGFFVNLAGHSCDSIGSLEPNGSWNSEVWLSPRYSGVLSLDIQADAKVVAGGWFSQTSNPWQRYVARINTNGSLDTTFATRSLSHVNSVRVLSDGTGRIVVGSGNGLERFYSDGTVELSLPANGLGVISLTIQSNGKMIVTGGFSHIGGILRTNLARINRDGTVDDSFNVRADAPVDFQLLLDNGDILVGGSFTNVGGKKRKFLARLNNNEPAEDFLTKTGSTIMWLRDGSSPEFGWTRVEHSTNGVDWTFLGSAVRASTGWVLTNSSLPSSGVLRAFGYTAGGAGSAGMVKRTIYAPWPVRSSVTLQDGSVLLKWNGGDGPYQVQAVPDIAAGPWTNFGAPISGTNAVAIPFQGSNGFLRVLGR